MMRFVVFGKRVLYVWRTILRFVQLYLVLFHLNYFTIIAVQLITMPSCQDSLCRDCFKFHFTLAISEKTASLIKCPLCDVPDIENGEEVHIFFQYLNMQVLL